MDIHIYIYIEIYGNIDIWKYRFGYTDIYIYIYNCMCI